MEELNFLFTTLLGLFDSVILACVVMASFRRFNTTRYIQFLYLTLEFLGVFLWIFFTSFSNLLVYQDIFVNGKTAPSELANLFGYAGYFSLLVMNVFLILFVDSISRTTVDPLKVLVYGGIAAMAIYAVLQPGQAAKDVTLLTYYVSALGWLFRSILWAYYAAKVYINSPDNLKHKSLTVLVGTFLAGIIPSFFLITMIVLPDVGINELLFLAGILLMAIPLVSEPKLLYVLPFRATKLAVFNDAGLPLFTHDWVPRENSDVDTGDALFSGIILGVSGILKETLQKGNIREIALDQSVLLLERFAEYPVTFVLETSKTSKSLPKALHQFSTRFIKQFEESLYQEIFTQKNYEAASDLVAQCFPFLPEYN